MQYLISRHPDLFLKSWGSFEAKVNYFERNLNRTMIGEETFPLVLYYSYNKVIRPRGDLLLQHRVKDFSFKDAFITTDDEFCKKFNIKRDEL